MNKHQLEVAQHKKPQEVEEADNQASSHLPSCEQDIAPLPETSLQPISPNISSPPIQATRSCPQLHPSKPLLPSSLMPDLSTSSQSPDTITSRTRSGGATKKASLDKEDGIEIRFLRKVEKDTTAEVKKILQRENLPTDGVFIEQTIPQDQFTGRYKFLRVILPSKNKATEMASRIKGLKNAQWKLPDVMPQQPTSGNGVGHSKKGGGPLHPKAGKTGCGPALNRSPIFPHPPPSPFLGLNPRLPTLMAAMGVPPPPPSSSGTAANGTLQLSIGCWNVAGWGKGVNSTFRKSVIHNCNLDIVCLCEYHLMHDEVLSIEGYTWFGHNRLLISPNARKGSGGVGILVKEQLAQHFSIEIIDNEFEGILWLQFIGLDTIESFCLYVCYLPPSNSTRGNMATEFFDHLISSIHSFQEIGKICICGDFNARCGGLQDNPNNSYDIPRRLIADHSAPNGHGRDLIDFLIASELCMLNGRGQTAQHSLPFQPKVAQLWITALSISTV